MKPIKSNKLPEGATSLEAIDKIYLSRILEEGGAGDLVPVLHSFSLGQILEGQGKYKEALSLYGETLKRDPRNPWIKAALERAKHTLN